MKLLDRHILRELIGPFFFGVAAFTSIMFAGQELFKITELLAEYHASVLTAVKLVILFMPGLIVITLPMAMLLSALLGFGRLSGDSEVVALFASGVSLYRVAVPVIIMSIVVTASSFVLNEIVAPKATLEHDRIVREFKADKGGGGNKPFVVIDARDGVTNTVIYVPPKGFKASTGTLNNIVVIQYEKNQPSLFAYAKEARWLGNKDLTDGGNWALRDGYIKSASAGQTIVFQGKDFQRITIEKTPEQFALYQRKPEQMSFSELKGYISMLESEGMPVAEWRVHLYQKIALPLSSLVFALIGTPLGLRPQRSSSAMGLGLSIVIIFAYYVIMHYMTIIGKNGALSPAAASFIPTLIGIGVGAALITRAAK